MERNIIVLIDKYKSIPKAAKASFWFVICGFLQKSISFITTPIFTRLLTTTEYGQYNTFNSWLNIVAVFATMRLSYSAYMQGLIRFDKDRERYTSSLLGLTASMILFAALVYFTFHKIINDFLELTTIMMCCMFIMILMQVAFEFWSARQRVDFFYKKLVSITLIMSVLNPLLGIIAVTFFSNKVEARIIEITCVEILCYGGLLFLQFFRGKKFYQKKYWVYAVSFSFPLIPHYLSQTILNQSDRLMIQKLIGLSETGIYSLAYNVASILVILNTALMNSYSPWLFKKLKREDTSGINKISVVLLFIIALANICLIAFAPEAIWVFGSDKYYSAIWVIPPVSMGVYFMFLYSMFASVEMYFGKTKSMMFASVIGALLNLILNYVFIPRFGFISAAYTTLFCYLVYSFLHYLFSKKICNELMNGVKIYNLKMVSILSLGFCLIGFAIMFTYNYTLIRYTIIILIVIVCIIKRRKI